MSQQQSTEPAATRRMVWYTIANAIGDSTLPEPSHLSFHPGGERSIVSMTFDRLDAAEKWARFLGWRPDDPVAVTRRESDRSVTFFAEKRGWRWHLHYNPIARVAEALLDADGADDRSSTPNAVGALSDRHMSEAGV